MTQQTDFLPKQERDWLSGKSEEAPRLWIEELRILKTLSGKDEDIIRRVQLKKGLNIIWAEPGERGGPVDQRGRGHAAGKTSFCRAIRYLLGEQHFANKFTRDRIQSHPSLKRGYLAATVWVDGNLWSVARPLYQGGRSFSVRDVPLSEALAIPVAERNTMEDFEKAIEDAIFEPFAVRHFDGKEEDPILWQHLIQFLTRDQETHLSSLHIWRDNASASDHERIDENERYFLVRCLLGCAGAEEGKIIEQRSEWQSKQNKEEGNITFYNRSYEESLSALSERFPDIEIKPDDDLFIGNTLATAREKAEGEINAVRKKIEKLGITKIEAEKEDLKTEKIKIAQIVSEPLEEIQKIEERRRMHEAGEEPPDGKSLRETVLESMKQSKLCSVPAEHALFKCPVYRELGIKEAPKSPEVKKLQKLSDDELALADRRIAEIRSGIESHIDRKKDIKARLEEIDGRLKELNKKKGGFENEINDLRSNPSDDVRNASNLVDALTKRDAAREAVGDCEKEIAACDEELEVVRSQNQQDQRRLSEMFNAISQYIGGPRYNGELSFTNIRNNAHLRRNGELESEAFKALKALAFDFTGIVARLNGIGFHPGFLMHDSPRESDLEPSLYDEFFKLVHSLERISPDSFQYIITTTEDPPNTLKQDEFVRLRLDGSEGDGRLYRQNL